MSARETDRSRGMTLVELMVTMVLGAMLFSLATNFAVQIWRSGRDADGYLKDLDQCRRALQRVEADLRRSSRVETVGAGYRLHLVENTAAVDYQLEQGVLTRSVAGRREVVGRRLGSFALRRRGKLVELQLGPMPRALGATAERAQIFSSIGLAEVMR